MDLLKLTEGMNRDGQEHLIDPSRPTFLGMAHFAGTGPIGRTCRECIFWMQRNRWARDGSLGTGGEPQPARCRKHRQFSMKHRGPRVPHDAHACKWFEEDSVPQPLKRPEKVSA